jgi:CRP-like cAMP-binding protein
VAVPYPPVRAALEQQPDALWSVVELLAGRLRSVDEALADTVFLDVPGRTAKRLLELAGDGDQFQLPVTQEELAGMVGASRERVNKAISQFVRLGWLEQQDRVYRILDRTQLSRRAR